MELRVSSTRGWGELGSSHLGESYFSISAWGPGRVFGRQGRILFRDSRSYPFKAKDPFIWIQKKISPMLNLEAMRKLLANIGSVEEEGPVLNK